MVVADEEEKGGGGGGDKEKRGDERRKGRRGRTMKGGRNAKPREVAEVHWCERRRLSHRWGRQVGYWQLQCARCVEYQWLAPIAPSLRENP
jgi:hypothetical protein